VDHDADDRCGERDEADREEQDGSPVGVEVESEVRSAAE